MWNSHSVFLTNKYGKGTTMEGVLQTFQTNYSVLLISEFDIKCVTKTLIAKSDKTCLMPLHEFTIFCYVPSFLDSKLF